MSAQPAPAEEAAVPAELPSALDRFETILARIGERQPALFLDFDGTLAPIVEHPDDAAATAEAHALVETLAARMPVAIVSGRDIAMLRTAFPSSVVAFAGGHGFEIVDRTGRQLSSADDPGGLLDILAARLTPLAAVDGNLMERKRHSLAVHFRRAAPETHAATEACVRAAVAGIPGLRIIPGKMVLDVQPDIAIDKGRAVLALLEAEGLDTTSAAPIFIGDDVTDEAGFAAVHADGIGILVAETPRPTAARFGLRDTDEVTAFLARLEAATRA